MKHIRTLKGKGWQIGVWTGKRKKRWILCGGHHYNNEWIHISVNILHVNLFLEIGQTGVIGRKV